ncbi:hypothetical protein JTE90_011976 [Oedothorax gibbosus]|uniref:Pre-C2HC domain-containing protein n=1 Tax=Oedothorax gibbosus TaxID=931172 RepID=A0AAV6U4P9_9ARAC|nr:hypothetical protein JTE90_011976 [Oedothorax gibbosus]
MFSLQDAAIKFLGELTAEEHIKVRSSTPNDCQTAGAELSCTVVPPGDSPRTPKSRQPQDGISARELVVNPSHPDSSAPSIDDCNNYSLPSTSSAMEITDEPDGNGIFIKNTKKAIKRKTSDTVSPSIVHPNKFQHLNPETSLDDIDPTQEIEDNFSQVNTRPTRIPPLIITNPQFKWTEIRKKLIDSLGEERFSGKTSGEHFKLQMTSEKGHRIASKLLEDLNIDYSTYAFKGQNPLKVIIKNLPADTDPAEIIQALKDPHQHSTWRTSHNSLLPHHPHPHPPGLQQEDTDKIPQPPTKPHQQVPHLHLQVPHLHLPIQDQDPTLHQTIIIVSIYALSSSNFIISGRNSKRQKT